jgi:hypothetical protein
VVTGVCEGYITSARQLLSATRIRPPHAVRLAASCVPMIVFLFHKYTRPSLPFLAMPHLHNVWYGRKSEFTAESHPCTGRPSGT